MRISVLVACLAQAVALPAQVFIVDAANGAGAHFTDLLAAVATVPDGATLRVRAGVYTPFTLSAKGLRILGEGSVSFRQTALIIGNTRASQVVLLRNVRLPSLGVQITDTASPVILERCQRDVFPQGFDVIALRAANLQLSGCAFDQGTIPSTARCRLLRQTPARTPTRPVASMPAPRTWCVGCKLCWPAVGSRAANGCSQPRWRAS